MSLRFALLGLLDDGPASGYDLTARFERSLRKYAWTARQSHVYPELKRLAEDDLVRVAAEGPRGRRTYAITDKGREALRAWLLAPPGERAVRDERVLRLSLLSALEIPQARAVLEHDLATVERELTELEALADQADSDPHPRGPLRFGRMAIEYGIYQYRAHREWTTWALNRLDQAETSRPG